MPASRPSLPSWPVIFTCGPFAIYGAVVFALASVGGPLPPPQLNSVVAGAFAASIVVAAVRIRPVACGCSTALAEMRQELQELREVARKLEEFESLPMELSAYMNDAAQFFELGREAERQRREGDEGSARP